MSWENMLKDKIGIKQEFSVYVFKLGYLSFGI